MIIDKNRDTLLKKSISLLIFISMEQGVVGQCTGGVPVNLAVYEGTQNTTIMCNNPRLVSWTFKPTTDEARNFLITNYDNVVAPVFKDLFGLNKTGLIIKTAQGLATIPPKSTAGLYFIQIIGNADRLGAKLIVVREPPSCSCTTFNSTRLQINCSLTYADASSNPIPAKMTWTTGDGSFLRNDTPTGAGRILQNGYWTSTSTIVIDGVSDPTNYACRVTFGAPTIATVPFVATNAPAFSSTCKPSFCDETATDLLASTTLSTPQMPIGSTPLQRATRKPTGLLSDVGTLGIGIGIGVGATVALVGIVFAVLCRRYECVKRTKTDEKTTNAMEGYYERRRSDEDCSYIQLYEPLRVLSAQDLNTEVLYESVA